MIPRAIIVTLTCKADRHRQSLTNATGPPQRASPTPKPRRRKTGHVTHDRNLWVLYLENHDLYKYHVISTNI